MAIQMRRGNDANFKPEKMVPGEFAVSLDAKKVYTCFSAGQVKELAFSEDVNDVKEHFSEFEERLEEVENRPSGDTSGSVSSTLKTILQRIQTEIKACLRDTETVPNDYIDTTDAMIGALGTSTDEPSQPIGNLTINFSDGTLIISGFTSTPRWEVA